MNVRTLNSKRQDISELLNKQNISIIGVVDHKLVYTDETRYTILGEQTIISTSTWRNSNNATFGGIGIILNKKTTESLSGIIK